jgi:hypothetical protein
MDISTDSDDWSTYQSLPENLTPYEVILLYERTDEFECAPPLVGRPQGRWGEPEKHHR